MSHKSVRQFIEATAKSLRDDLKYSYGRTSDFDVMRDKQYPFITLDALDSTPQFATDSTWNYTKSWSCVMAFYQLDQKASIPEQYQLILDEMDELVDKFLNKLNTYSYDSDKILIQNISQQAIIKATADVLTGYILTFTLLVQDDFDYCADDLDCAVNDECGNN